MICIAGSALSAGMGEYWHEALSGWKTTAIKVQVHLSCGQGEIGIKPPVWLVYDPLSHSQSQRCSFGLKARNIDMLKHAVSCLHDRVSILWNQQLHIWVSTCLMTVVSLVGDAKCDTIIHGNARMSDVCVFIGLCHIPLFIDWELQGLGLLHHR